MANAVGTSAGRNSGDDSRAGVRICGSIPAGSILSANSRSELESPTFHLFGFRGTPHLLSYDTGDVSELILFDRFWSKIVVLTLSELVTLDTTDGSTATSSVIAGSVVAAATLAA